MAHHRVHFLAAHLLHVEHDLAVVEQQHRARTDVARQLLVVEARALAVADLEPGVEHEALSLLERHHAVLELADADLGTLQVAKDRHGAAHLGGKLLHQRGALLVVLRRAVREIEPHHVDARANHPLEDCGFG